jgi:hypothetical protein
VYHGLGVPLALRVSYAQSQLLLKVLDGLVESKLLCIVLTVFFEEFEFEGPAPLKVFEIVFFEEFKLKVFKLKGSLKVLEKVLEKVFRLKVFEFEGALPFK